MVEGPAGIPIEWDATLVKVVPNQLLAWKSLPGSAVGHAGVVHFRPRDGGTQVDIQLVYNPPAGVMGHAVASLLGSNPKQAMDEDLVRFKSLFEEGKTTAEGETITRERVTNKQHAASA